MSRLANALATALSAVARSKGRTALTVLGILIGIASIVVVSALGDGVDQRIGAQIRSLGSNVIFIWSQTNQSSGARSARILGRLTEADGKAILRESTSVSAVVGYLQAPSQVVAGDKNVATTVVGTSRGFLAVRGYNIAEGASFTETNERVKEKVCLLGSTVKQNLFGSTDAIGQIVRVGRYPFRVVGVLSPKGQTMSGDDQDDRIMIPAGTFRSRVLATPPGRVHVLVASATDERTVGRAARQIEAVLRQRHGIEADREPDFGMRTQADFLKTQERISNTLHALFAGIGLVSLGVGGIGVMNIMLVSVTERTREIGTRMAIGAREWDVQFQFLVEAITLCFIGGLGGTMVGVVAVYAVSHTLGWSMVLPPSALAIGLATSFAVGLFFGSWPARRAARLDPIEALRHE
jgi:putative ABC transport system permease protein